MVAKGYEVSSLQWIRLIQCVRIHRATCCARTRHRQGRHLLGQGMAVIRCGVWCDCNHCVNSPADGTAMIPLSPMSRPAVSQSRRMRVVPVVEGLWVRNITRIVAPESNSAVWDESCMSYPFHSQLQSPLARHQRLIAKKT